MNYRGEEEEVWSGVENNLWHLYLPIMKMHYLELPDHITEL